MFAVGRAVFHHDAVNFEQAVVRDDLYVDGFFVEINLSVADLRHLIGGKSRSHRFVVRKPRFVRIDKLYEVIRIEQPKQFRVVPASRRLLFAE